MSDSPFFLGVDAGGTKTLAIVVDATGTERGRCTAGGGNYAAVGFTRAIESVRTAVAEATRLAGAQLPLPTGWFGLAGLDRPAEYEVWLPHLRQLACSVRLTNDGELPLSALEDAVGVALIAGTGAITIGRGPDGAVIRSGGWGHIIGDEGSGYDMGRLALQAASRAVDGRGPQTRLLPAILSHWRLDGFSDVIGRVYPEGEKDLIAGLAALVVAEARQGDAVARGILRHATGEVALAALTVGERIGLTQERLPLAMAGGLLVRAPEYRTMVLRRIRHRRPVGQVAVVEEPALSAARAARTLLKEDT